MNEFQYLILDLDETLYPRRTGLMAEIGRRILLYLTSRMGFAPDEAADVKKRFFVRYGTTLRGLQIEYQVNADDYLHFVHDVPLENYIEPAPALDAMLGRLRATRLTTARRYARWISRWGISRAFSAMSASTTSGQAWEASRAISTRSKQRQRMCSRASCAYLLAE